VEILQLSLDKSSVPALFGINALNADSSNNVITFTGDGMAWLDLGSAAKVDLTLRVLEISGTLDFGVQSSSSEALSDPR